MLTVNHSLKSGCSFPHVSLSHTLYLLFSIKFSLLLFSFLFYWICCLFFLPQLQSDMIFLKHNFYLNYWTFRSWMGPELDSVSVLFSNRWRIWGPEKWRNLFINRRSQKSPMLGPQNSDYCFFHYSVLLFILKDIFKDF